MVLSKEQQKTKLNLDTYKYLVLNTEHFYYGSEVFATAIEVMAVANRAAWINESCEKIGSPLLIDAKPFYDLIDCVLKQQPMPVKSIETMFRETKKLWLFVDSMRNHVDADSGSSGFDLPLEACYMAHGLSYDQFGALPKNTKGSFSEAYCKLYIEVLYGKIPMGKYHHQVNKLIEGLTNKVKVTPRKPLN